MPVFQSEHFEGVVEKWEKAGDRYAMKLSDIEDAPEQFINEQLNWIDEAQAPTEKFIRLMRVFTFINAAVEEDASFLDPLQKWLARLLDKLRDIAKACGATNFLIHCEITWPPSVYVELGFETESGTEEDD